MKLFDELLLAKFKKKKKNKKIKPIKNLRFAICPICLRTYKLGRNGLAPFCIHSGLNVQMVYAISTDCNIEVEDIDRVRRTATDEEIEKMDKELRLQMIM